MGGGRGAPLAAGLRPAAAAARSAAGRAGPPQLSALPSMERQLPAGRPPRLVSSLGLGQRCSEVTLDQERGLLAWRHPRRGGECRPKRLLVYINPYGGKRQGKRIYEQKVAPLFSLASISTDVVITEHANHAKDNLFEVNINKYDGVVCVGGDGMFSEVMHGLIGRMQKDSGIDQNNPKAPLVQCNIRIGIIPAGSTDCVCYSTVGISDPVTSALHIIVGDSQPLDVSSVHHNNTFLKYSVSLLGYGFYGDILKDSEKKRWMGPMRYDYSGFKTFLSHHYYEGTISFQPAKHTLGSPRDKDSCRTGCYICKESEQQLAEQQKKCGLKNEGIDKTEYRHGWLHRQELHSAIELRCIRIFVEDEEEWKVIKGKFLAINAVNMSCACPRSPKGLSPAAHLADGSADLILVRKCSRFDFLRHLVRNTNQNDQFDFSFVDVYRVKSFQFTSKLSEDNGSNVADIGKKRFGQFCRDHPACCCNIADSTWNCDGETLDSSAIEVRVHCQLMKLFARGIEENCKDEAAYSHSSIEHLL